MSEVPNYHIKHTPPNVFDEVYVKNSDGAGYNRVFPSSSDGGVSSVNGYAPDASGNVTISAQDVGALTKADPSATGLLTVTNTATTTFKTQLAKYMSGTGHTDAATTLGTESQYLVIGGHEYGANSFRGIGYGYDAENSIAPVFAGIQEISTAAYTYGDFVIATRASTGNVSPTIIARFTHDGHIVAENPAYTPTLDNSLVNKKYVDDKASITLPVVAGTAAIGVSETFALADHKHPLQPTVAALTTGRTFSLTGGATGTSAAFTGAASVTTMVTLAAPTAVVRGGIIQAAAIADIDDGRTLVAADFNLILSALRMTGVIAS